MRVILDTNVFISGVFFGGLPARIRGAWRDDRIQPVLSAEILEEYQRVGQILGRQYPGVDLGPFLALLSGHAGIVEAPAVTVDVASGNPGRFWSSRRMSHRFGRLTDTEDW